MFENIGPGHGLESSKQMHAIGEQPVEADAIGRAAVEADAIGEQQLKRTLSERSELSDL